MVLISSKPLWTHCEFNKMLSYFNRNINNNNTLTFNVRVSTANSWYIKLHIQQYINQWHKEEKQQLNGKSMTNLILIYPH